MNASAKDNIGIALIILCSILLGVWATAHTIALRNILLVIAGILSIIYLSKWLNNYSDSSVATKLWQSDPLILLPSILIVMMFIWIVLHYLFLSKFPEKQWEELSSTWLRAFLAAIIGFGCANALSRNPSYNWLLWLGLVVSFLLLIYQYTPKAIMNGSLFAIDHHGNYIYWAKFSGVLAGIILFSGSLGLLIDSASQFSAASSARRNESHRFNKVIPLFVTTSGLLLPLYSFVFIFSAKNGVGVVAILLIFWFMVGSIYLWTQLIKDEGRKKSGWKWAKWTASYLIILMIFFGFFTSIQKITLAGNH